MQYPEVSLLILRIREFGTPEPRVILVDESWMHFKDDCGVLFYFLVSQIYLTQDLKIEEHACRTVQEGLDTCLSHLQTVPRAWYSLIVLYVIMLLSWVRILNWNYVLCLHTATRSLVGMVHRAMDKIFRRREKVIHKEPQCQNSHTEQLGSEHRMMQKCHITRRSEQIICNTKAKIEPEHMYL